MSASAVSDAPVIRDFPRSTSERQTMNTQSALQSGVPDLVAGTGFAVQPVGAGGEPSLKLEHLNSMAVFDGSVESEKASNLRHWMDLVRGLTHSHHGSEQS